MKDIKDKVIGILGSGISGLSVKGLIEDLGGTAVIFDEKRIDDCENQFTPKKAKELDLLINSPGFPPTHPWFKIAEDAGCEMMNEVGFASNYWEGRRIFVTGTNGKSTITHLLTATFLNAGYEAYAFGNIGIPFSDHYKFNASADAIAVIELSSFQAWNLKIRDADGLIWSNFAEDHLDWHGEIIHYFDSKWNAVQSVLDAPIVIGSGVLDCALELKKQIPPQTIVVDDRPERFYFNSTLSAVNQLNIEYVKRFVAHYHIGEETVDEIVKNFAFLPHRLEHVMTAEGIDFWNDSKATNFHAVEAALDSFYTDVIWLGGGQSKGGDLQGFVNTISSKIKKAVVFGQVSQELSESLISKGVLTFVAEDLEEAVKVLKFEALHGDQVVLSPGFASFDQFNSYADRGTQYRFLVEKYFNTHTELHPVQINN